MNIADVSPILNDFYAAKAHADAFIRAVSGFAIAPWPKRYGSGHCSHVDPFSGQTYFHINNGWDFSRQVIVPGHFRTKDFKTVEQAIEPINVLPVTFGELASLNGKLFRTNGFWNYPQQPGNDHTTSNVYMSDTGGFWMLDASAPAIDRECHMALAHTDGCLYIGMGERYSINPPPTYQMPTDFLRRNIAGWTQQNNTMRPRRSFAYFSSGSSIVIGCGRDDTNYPTVVDLNDFIASTDGGVTFQVLGNAPFRGAYGRRAAPFHGGIVLVGGAYSTTGNGNTANTTYLNEIWWTDTPLLPSTYVALPPLPIACVHGMVGVLTVDGVETLAVISGYNSNDRPDGSPYGTIFTFAWADGVWRARRDSGFWVDP